MRTAPLMTAIQPSSVMITGQSATHTLWLSTTASPAGIRIMPEKNISAGLRRNSCASLRNAASLASTLTPTRAITGPINRARKMEVAICPVPSPA